MAQILDGVLKDLNLEGPECAPFSERGER